MVEYKVAKPFDPHIKIETEDEDVFLVINGIEYRMSPKLARYVGDALFQTGADMDKDEK